MAPRCASSPPNESPPPRLILTTVERDPEAQQQFRDILPRIAGPRSDVFTPERLERWFSEAAANP